MAEFQAQAVNQKPYFCTSMPAVTAMVSAGTTRCSGSQRRARILFSSVVFTCSHRFLGPQAGGSIDHGLDPGPRYCLGVIITRHDQQGGIRVMVDDV